MTLVVCVFRAFLMLCKTSFFLEGKRVVKWKEIAGPKRAHAAPSPHIYLVWLDLLRDCGVPFSVFMYSRASLVGRIKIVKCDS